jgi:hypothetical protein
LLLVLAGSLRGVKAGVAAAVVAVLLLLLLA